MDDSLHLDGVQFADEESVLCGDSADVVVEDMAYLEDDHMMMDTATDEIVGLDMDAYDVAGEAGADMPALGGEEEVLTLQSTLADLPPTPAHQLETSGVVLGEVAEGSAQSVPLRVVQPRQVPHAAHRMYQPIRTVSAPPREVAIAPKPSVLPVSPGKVWPANTKLVIGGAKQSVVKKLTIGNLVQAGQAGGKQLVVVAPRGVPGAPGAGARLKLVQAGGGGTLHYISRAAPQQSVVLPAVRRTAPLTKLLVQGEPGAAAQSGGGGVIAKILPTSGGPARYITLQQGGGGSGAQPVLRVRPRTQHVISVSSPPKLVTNAPGSTVGKKVLMSSAGGAGGGLVLKPAAGGGGQLHQINVPGKGVQYIRVVTNSSKLQPASTTTTAPASTLLLAENQRKPQQKLVRIAPVAKSQPQSLLAVSAVSAPPRTTARSAQSLLAPRSPPAPAPAPSSPPAAAAPSLPAPSLPAPPSLPAAPSLPAPPSLPASPSPCADDDSKVALQALVDQMRTNVTLPLEYEESKGVPENGCEQTVCTAGPLEESEEEEDGNEEHDSTPDHQYHQVTVSSYLERYLQEAELGRPPGTAAPAPAHAHTASDALAEGAADRPRKACNCTKSQCLKLYCDCFANGEFCHQCNCTNCHNNLDNEELRQKAIRSCLERNPNAFRPKIGKGKSAVGPEPVRRHNKGCNCKRSGCLKNYCECYEAKIACGAICRCVGCRNVEDGARGEDELPVLGGLSDYRRPPLQPHYKQPCSLMTAEVVEAVCQCLVAAGATAEEATVAVLDEFSRCLQDIIGAARQTPHDAQLQA